MAAKVLDKLMSFFGMDEPDEKDEIREIPDTVIPYNRKPKIVNIHTQSQVKVLIVKPERFEQVQDICNELKNKKPVIIDLQSLEKTDAQRLIDFLSGAIYALNGEIKKISNHIFFIVPENFDISGDIKDDINSVYNLT